MHRFILAIFTGAALLVQAQPGPSPSTFIVTNLEDAGPGSLRQAILNANANPGADVITFAAGLHGTIRLSTGELTILDSVEIDGPGALELAINGNDAARVFDIEGAAPAPITVVIKALTIEHGLAGGGGGHPGLGGGIYVSGAALTLNGVVVAHNRAIGTVGTAGANPGLGAGGGIYVGAGTLTIDGGGLVGNQAVGAGGPGVSSVILDPNAPGFLGGALDLQGAGAGGGIFNLAGPVILTQADIRELQLAKGAMAAGLRMLAGGGVEKLCLAGAFGNYIRQASARAIGLLPEDLQVEPVGNSALRGARTLLLAPSTRQARLRKIAALSRHVELAADPDFQYLFAERMAFARYRLSEPRP